MDKSQRGLVKKAMRGNPKDFGTLIQEELATYTGVDVGNYGQGAVTATINGEAAAVEGVNPFYEREGQWVSTMTLAVPQSQQDAETLSLEVTLQDLEGRVENEEAQAAADQDQLARLEWEANEETAGTPLSGGAAGDCHQPGHPGQLFRQFHPSPWTGSTASPLRRTQRTTGPRCWQCPARLSRR